ncbi:hypothetical protein BDZ91DRAFT_752423 [Kalaharituber pfeilii]|nr:hypothetical protein BDZ91DRAFT_752423 [Kalaharituber pfeilii]
MLSNIQSLRNESDNLLGTIPCQQLPSQIASTKKYVAYRTIPSCFEDSLADASENFDIIKFDTTHIHNVRNEDTGSFNIETEEVIADTEELAEDTDPVDQDQLDEDGFEEREPGSLFFFFFFFFLFHYSHAALWAMARV